MAARVPFAERLLARRRARATCLVVGLDPHPARLPAEFEGREPAAALAGFCSALIECVAEQALAVKPQVAFFERLGWRGWRALQDVLAAARRREVPVILDAKRGDIGSTAAAYAEGLLGERPDTPGPYVDALTVNPYLGEDSLTPFIEHAVRGARGLFVLARTSNPGARDFQDRRTGDEPLYRAVAAAIARWGSAHRGASGYGPLGLVAGATYPSELGEVRAAAPHSLLLVPGFGAQGGTIQDLRPAFDADGWGALPSSSRAIIYAWEATPDVPWRTAVEQAAARERAALETGLGETGGQGPLDGKGLLSGQRPSGGPSSSVGPRTPVGPSPSGGPGTSKGPGA